MDNDPKHDALRFGKYEVLRDAGGGPMLLGSGSYGRTYKARHLMLGTEVAIKVIRRELTASESTRQRFLREGRALAGLAHDHIALLRYFDCGDDGQLYYAMDYCAGGTLAERVRRRGPRPVGEALEIVRQAASALVAAHAAGIIHRDLKPGNIMLAHAPPPVRVKVIDFGLAQSSGTGATGGRFHGTAQWASPEQLREAPIDGRSDLFSLGLILWFLLEGAAPDPGDTSEVVQRRLDPGGYAQRLPQGLPPDVRRLLGNLLETEPSRRVASAVVLLERLSALCAAHPYQPVAEPDEDDAAGGEAAGAAELLLEHAGDDRYARMTRLHRDLAGEWFEAELDGGQGQRMVFVLDEHLAEHPGLRDKVRANLARLRRQPVDALPRLPVYYETGGTLVAEFEGTGGGDLASWLRLRRKVDLRDALGFLARVAAAADDAHACGLPGLGLMAVQVRRGTGGSGGESGSTGTSLRGAEPRLFPLLLAAADLPPGDAMAADASGSTLVLAAPELACDRFFMLAKLIYRMVSGRETPDAVAHSPGAYITVSALTEQGNAILREALGRRSQWDSCGGLLGDLAAAENLSLNTSGSASAPPSGGRTGVPPVREDSASRLSAHEPPGWKPVGQDRRDACPPVAPVLTVTPVPPVKRQPMSPVAYAGWVVLGLLVLVLAGVYLFGGNDRTPKPGPETSAAPSVPLVPSPVPQPQKQPPEVSPATATKDRHFVNSLGMEFAPVPITGGPDAGQKVLFCIWETRVKDFAAFVKTCRTYRYEAGSKPFIYDGNSWKHSEGAGWQNPGFSQTDKDPVTCVSYEDGVAFCRWLTEQEKKTLPANAEYRLPTDHEWSCAVGIGGREVASATPQSKDMKIEDIYPRASPPNCTRGTNPSACRSSCVTRANSASKAADSARPSTPPTSSPRSSASPASPFRTPSKARTTLPS